MSIWLWQKEYCRQALALKYNNQVALRMLFGICLDLKEYEDAYKAFELYNDQNMFIQYNISPNSSAALRKADGRAEAHLIQIACSPAPEGHSRWTIRLLEEKARIKLSSLYPKFTAVSM